MRNDDSFSHPPGPQDPHAGAPSPGNGSYILRGGVPPMFTAPLQPDPDQARGDHLLD